MADDIHIQLGYWAALEEIKKRIEEEQSLEKLMEWVKEKREELANRIALLITQQNIP